MMLADASLHALEEHNPQWSSWLQVLGEVMSALPDKRWDDAVPLRSTTRVGPAPGLAGAALEVDHGALVRLFERTRHCAVRSGAPALTSLRAMSCSEERAAAIFIAALNSDDAALATLAAQACADAGALCAIATLLPMPFLHACARAWGGETSREWREGYCPICGAWPALAEICGVERSRYLRCGRCGSGWQAVHLSCAYCGMKDHEQLASLVAEHGEAKSSIELCNGCHGYLKAFARLTCAPPAQVLLNDLASVELDLAAAERGYARPPGTGHALHATLASGRGTSRHA